MEKVKSDSKNIHAKRPLFLNIGLVLALVACFLAFEFKVHIPENDRVDIPIDVAPTFLSDKIKPTVQKPKPRPEIPVKKKSSFVITETKAEAIEQVSDVKHDIKLDDLSDLIDDGGPGIEVVVDPTVHIIVDREPEYKGGVEAFYRYLSENIEYPRTEKRMNIDGRVYLQFVIEVDGSLTDIQVIKGVSDGLDKEAVRVLKETPNWVPGAIRGQPVRVRMTIPINFKLQ